LKNQEIKKSRNQEIKKSRNQEIKKSRNQGQERRWMPTLGKEPIMLGDQNDSHNDRLRNGRDVGASSFGDDSNVLALHSAGVQSGQQQRAARTTAFFGQGQHLLQ
jgi:hypothetical protein